MIGSRLTGYRAAPRSAALRRAAVHTTQRRVVHSPALLARHQRRCHRLRAAERGDDAATTAVVDEQQKEQQQAAEDSSGADAVAATAQHEAQKTAAAEGSSSNNTSSSSSSSSSYKWDPDTWRPDAAALPAEPAFEPLAGGALAWARLKMALALPWRRVKKGSALTFKLEGDVSDALKGRFAPGVSLPQVVSALEKAALDPRVSGIAVEIGPLSCGYARIEELRRAIARFRESGKYAIAWMKIATEREYYLATAFGEVYAAPTASLRLNGFTVGGTFLRGVLDKAGVEPQVQRIGRYKSAGDQLLRRTMAPEQREQLGALLEETYAAWVDGVAAARGKTRDDVEALLNEGVFDNRRLLEGGWLDGLKYEDEVAEDLRRRTNGLAPAPAPAPTPAAADGEEAAAAAAAPAPADDKAAKKDAEKPVKKVGLRKYSSVRRGTFGLDGGKKRVAVLRCGGAILGASSSGGSNVITPDAVIPRLRALAKDKSVAAVVLRVDSPGGDALASDLMWREIKQLGLKKPVVACMGDVAASGGYYMSMAASAGIVAAPLTVTGSIGVVTGKFNLAELYAKLGYSKELLSKGKYAQLLAADNRAFNADEQALFERSAQFAYESFRDKAAESRRMSVDAMQAVAQGRVWSGRDALARGLVDVLGTVKDAVALARQAAGIAADEKVTVVEVTRAATSPLALLAGGGASAASTAAAAAVALTALARGAAPAAALQAAAGTAWLQQLGAAAAAAAAATTPLGLDLATAVALAQGLANGQALAFDPDAAALASGGVMKTAATAASSSGSSVGSSVGSIGSLFDEDDGGIFGALTSTLDEPLL